MSQWPAAQLGKVIQQRKDFVLIDDFTEYKRCRVQLHAEGIVLRDTVSGAEIKTKKQQVCKAGDFLVAEIDAKVGGFGIVPDELDGAIVSSHYFLFDVKEDQLNRSFLDYFIRTPNFRDQVTAQGSTNYAAIRPNDVLGYEIPLPPLSDQRRIVVRIEELAAKIKEARILRINSANETEAILRSAVTRLDQDLRRTNSVAVLENYASAERGAIRSGPFGSALLHSEFVVDGIPAIGIQDVQENRFKLTRRWNITPEKAEELRRYTVKPRDIVVTVMGTLGRACVVPDDIPWIVSTKHVWTVTLDQTLAEPKWVSYWLNFSGLVRDKLLGQGTGTAIPGLNGEKIRALSLPDIPLLDQRNIVAELDALHAQVDALTRLQADTAAELDALLPSILDKAFKGEL
jgi:type I restriction enzyme, S subunit